MEKPKVHVFLGAPTLPLTDTTDPNLDCNSWETMELCLLGKSLQPKEAKTRPQDCDAGPSDSTLVNDMRTDCFTLANESLFRLNIDNNAVLVQCPKKTDMALNVREHSQEKIFVYNEEEMYPKAVQEYLDSCFSDSESSPKPPEAQPSSSVSLETEYLTLWTMSQTLVLKGMLGVHDDPEQAGTLCTPASPHFTNLGSSSELYSLASNHSESKGVSQDFLNAMYERQEEGGVQLEVTPEGLLCSQQSQLRKRKGAADEPWFMRSTDTSTTASLYQTFPVSKKTRVSPSGVRTQEPLDQMKRIVGLDQLGHTTPLARCVTRGVPYNIMVAVVYPCHLKEIKMKSGAWAGSTVPLATIVVTDQSGVEKKVVLWRKTAFWALTVYPGEVLLITGVMVNEDSWRGELVLQSSRSSTLLNLGQVASRNSPRVPRNVNGRTLDLLCAYLKEKHPLLLTLPAQNHQDLSAIPHVRLRALKPDTLVHIVARVTHTSIVTAWRVEASSSSKTGGVQKAMLSVEQDDGQQGEVVLWGAAMSWLHRIQRNKDAVWEFRVLLVKENITSGSMELHSTPWGSCEPLFLDDKRAQEFSRQTHSGKNLVSFEIDLQTLLSQKYTGDVELRCQITGFKFQSSPSQDALPLVNRDTPLERILHMMSGDITFAGCERCVSQLGTDANGIYRPCYPCLPHTGVRRYYRPALLMVKDGSSEVCIQVPSILVQKILQNIPPEKLSKCVAPSLDRRFVHVAAEVLHSLLYAQRTVTLTVHSHFLCDENSIAIVQDFLLLDFDPQA
ncbi:protein FAM35A [Arapaima gigas]